MKNLAEAERVIRLVMPVGPQLAIERDGNHASDLIIHVGNHRLRARLVEHPNLATIQLALTVKPRPNIVMLSRTSPAIRELLENNQVGWVTGEGAANIFSGAVIVSREKFPISRQKPVLKWRRSMLGVAEALLTGTPGTVEAIAARTGLSQGSSSKALETLFKLQLLTAEATRGRLARRKIVDHLTFLSAYADAANQIPHQYSMAVGVLWQDPIKSLADIGKSWTSSGIKWAATSAIASAEIASFGTLISPLEIFIDASSPVTMIEILKSTGLKRIEGGRLTVAPFPTTGTRQQISWTKTLPVVPWPRAFADLQIVGVRGEEIADHLRKQMWSDFDK